MSDAEDQAQGEPTMEEILASIRRIISEDAPEEEKEAQAEDVEAAAEPEPDPEPEPQPEPEPEPEEPPVEAPPAEDDGDDDDALELTQMVAEDGSVVDLNAEREAREEVEDAPEIELEEQPEPDPEPAAEPEPDDSLLSNAAQAAATSSLLDLARTADQQSISGLTDGGSRTLEMLVRETLEPHLKTWLDDNLPVLVERIVREEIQKMVKRAEYR